MERPDLKETDSNQGQALYRLIWRWHFYAGLLCLPLMITLSVSGAIYLFKPQIDAWVNKPYQQLTISGARNTANQQIEAALASSPGAQFSAYQLPSHQHQAVIIHLLREGNKLLVYINPYTLEVLKIVDYDSQFIRMVRTFHGELLAGNIGSVIVELAACWAIVLVISGLYLWWPRGPFRLSGILYPRFHLGKQVLWRDLHAVTGFWISSLVLFLLISGLPWAKVWGGAFKEIRQWSTTPVVQDWSLSRQEEHAHHQAEEQRPQNGIVLSETLLASAMALDFAPPVLLSIFPDNHDLWIIRSQSQNRPLRADAWLHGQTGEQIRIKSFSERPLIDRIVGIGVAAHEGQLFGWFNQLLGVIAALGLVTVSISGFILWRRRKPEGVVGAPIPLPNARMGNTVTVITILLAVFLPLLAISLVTILLLEWLVLRRFEISRRWLGLQNS